MTIRLFDASSDKPISVRIMDYVEDLPLSLNSLLEVLPDGIAFVDEYGVISHVNERLEVLTGCPRDLLVGQAVDVLLQSRYQDAHAARRRGFVRDTPSRAQVRAGELEYSLLCQDGRELTVDVARAPFALDGKPWSVVAVRDDSTQKTSRARPHRGRAARHRHRACFRRGARE